MVLQSPVASCTLPARLSRNRPRAPCACESQGLRVPEPKDLGSVFQLGALSWNLTLTEQDQQRHYRPQQQYCLLFAPPPPPTAATAHNDDNKNYYNDDSDDCDDDEDGTVPLNLLVGHTTAAAHQKEQ